MANFRSKALRDSANGESCVACGRQDGTVVWAHSNEQSHGKGIGIKAHDLLGNYLCAWCHTLYDHDLSREDAREYFSIFYPKTMARIAEKLASGELKL